MEVHEAALRHQHFIELFEQRVHLRSKQLIHLPQPALPVEGRHFEVVAVDVERDRDVVADHVQPVHLFLVEFLAAARVMRHDPALEVAANGIVEVRQLVVHAADAADQCNQRGELVDRLLSPIIVELAVGLPDAQRRELGLVGLELAQHLVDQRETQLAPSVRLTEEDRQRGDAVLVGLEVVGKVAGQRPRVVGGVLVPFGAQHDVDGVVVDLLFLVAADRFDELDEFGVELGLQSAVLFNRSILSNVVNSGATILNATQVPGFNFNNQPLSSGGANLSKASPSTVGTQGISSFNVGRTNTDRGFGGLVLSASSDSVSVLLRALKETHSIEILARPQVMSLDNQPAYIQVGKRVPRIAGTALTAATQVNSIVLENVGLILGVTPRISPEGMVVMELDAEKSEMGPQSEGVPVSVSGGVPILSPSINVTTAQTTVSAHSGETIVLGGLITRLKEKADRHIPLLGDIPVVGELFGYKSTNNERHELLIIMTPHVVRSGEETDRAKQIEASRMHWCLGDVEQIHGNLGLSPGGRSMRNAPVVYPDDNPRGILPKPPQPGPGNGVPQPPAAPELVPAPGSTPMQPVEPPPPQPGPSAPLAPQPMSANPLRSAWPVAGHNTPGPDAYMPEAAGNGAPSGWPQGYPRPAESVVRASNVEAGTSYPATAQQIPVTNPPTAWPQGTMLPWQPSDSASGARVPPGTMFPSPAPSASAPTYPAAQGTTGYGGSNAGPRE